MLNLITKSLARIAEWAGSVAGVRTAPEPPHSSQKLTDHIELRRYGPRIAAETVVAGDEATARSAGFRRLAAYIFGENHRADSIAMTAPVDQRQIQANGVRIAMTAPVATASALTRGWVIRFYMPAEMTLQSLPVPNDERVQLISVPASSVAVLRFTGVADQRAVALRTNQLRDALRRFGFEASGPPATWFYDPPWTIPFRRRNEIAIPIDETISLIGSQSDERR